MRDNTKKECKVLRTDRGGTGEILHCIIMSVVTKVKVLTYKAFLISHIITIFGLQHNVDGAPLSCAMHNTCNIYETFLQHSQRLQSFHS